MLREGSGIHVTFKGGASAGAFLAKEKEFFLTETVCLE